METPVQTEVTAPNRRTILNERNSPQSRLIRVAQVVALAIAPAVMWAGLLYHPHIGNPTDEDFLATLAAAVTADTVRWAIAHLLVAAGSALILLGFLVIRSRLRVAGEERWSVLGVPFIVLGSVGYALLPAMEFVPLAAANAGNDVAAAQGALLPWLIPTLFSSATLYLAGTIFFAVGLMQSRFLNRRLAWLVVGALVVVAVSRMVPLGIIQMNVQAWAGLAAFWPLAYAISKRS